MGNKKKPTCGTTADRCALTTRTQHKHDQTTDLSGEIPEVYNRPTEAIGRPNFEGKEEKGLDRREANRRRQRQTNQHHGLVPTPPPPPLPRPHLLLSVHRLSVLAHNRPGRQVRVDLSHGAVLEEVGGAERGL